MTTKNIKSKLILLILIILIIFLIFISTIFFTIIEPNRSIFEISRKVGEENVNIKVYKSNWYWEAKNYRISFALEKFADECAFYTDLPKSLGDFLDKNKDWFNSSAEIQKQEQVISIENENIVIYTKSFTSSDSQENIAKSKAYPYIVIPKDFYSRSCR